MEGKSVFISSCSRRDLARRRPARLMFPDRLLVAVGLIAVLLAVFVLVNGGL